MSPRHRTQNPPESCAICGEDWYRREWCSRHYKRWLRHGDPEAGGGYREPSPPQTCLIEDCDKPHKAKGLCSAHYTRLLKYGDPLISLRPDYGQTTTYRAAHERVRAVYGSASDYECVLCGTQAAHWAYNHMGDPEYIGWHMDSWRIYSMDPDDYRPLCPRCHVHFDRGLLPDTTLPPRPVKAVVVTPDEAVSE